jgi:hypothetical protein
MVEPLSMPVELGSVMGSIAIQGIVAQGLPAGCPTFSSSVPTPLRC